MQTLDRRHTFAFQQDATAHTFHSQHANLLFDEHWQDVGLEAAVWITLRRFLGLAPVTNKGFSKPAIYGAKNPKTSITN